MCGITGIFAFNLVGKFHKIHVTAATMSLEKRGPDFQDIYLEEWVALGHRRLSIIDTSEVSNQPMWDDSKRYCIVFNGEIFNFRELRKYLEGKGVTFFSTGDTEVLLKLFIHEGESCLNKLNGFFSFCIYDKHDQSLFLARDRYGIKPLYYCFDEDKFIFGSEMKAIFKYGIEKNLDADSLKTYLQLNYIPAPSTILKNVSKLLPGHKITVKRQAIDVSCYYSIPQTEITPPPDYEEAKKRFADLLEDAVKSRLVADVPLGSFLSGGIDSSVIAGLAARHKPDLHTFSIGFRDEKFFDETQYARLVAKHFKTDHTVFSLTNDDLYAHLGSVLDYTDEPFADSSALAVYILCRETRKLATVALSGDGADELLGGYNKHAAFYQLMNASWKEKGIAALHPLWKTLPHSRSNKITNLFRQFYRFSTGSRLDSKQRYWKWASFIDETDAENMLSEEMKAALTDDYKLRRNALLKAIRSEDSMNELLLTDLNVVLPNDMLTKVDLMSMANSLEVRVPFLDYRLVNFAASLPDSYKVDRTIRKKILQDAFREFLPADLYNRPKKGFEVPLLKWFRGELRPRIQEVLDRDFIINQRIFDAEALQKVQKQLFSTNPGDSHATVWALIVFQHWWKKYFK